MVLSVGGLLASPVTSGTTSQATPPSSQVVLALLSSLHSLLVNNICCRRVSRPSSTGGTEMERRVGGRARLMSELPSPASTLTSELSSPLA